MANKHKGEVDLILCGIHYTLRPTFEALVEFEDKAQTTAYDVMHDMSKGRAAGFRVIAAAIWAGIKGGWSDGSRRPPAFVEVGEAIRCDGLASVLPVFGQFLSNALSSEADLKTAADEDAAGKAPQAGATS